MKTVCISDGGKVYLLQSGRSESMTFGNLDEDDPDTNWGTITSAANKRILPQFDEGEGITDEQKSLYLELRNSLIDSIKPSSDYNYYKLDKKDKGLIYVIGIDKDINVIRVLLTKDLNRDAVMISMDRPEVITLVPTKDVNDSNKLTQDEYEKFLNSVTNKLIQI